jgi:geranylgeranyl diphosphate synthase type II
LPARVTAFERALARALDQRCRAPGRLGEAIRYAALSPGKRLRPLLVLLSCEAVGGKWRAALPAAIAVECVHAFSLVHDDLPAMDDDDFRRGLPTTHKKYGEGVAILAGDALIAFAFQELSRLVLGGVSPRRTAQAVHLLARASGGEELIAGQALDLAAEGQPVSEDDVAEIHSRKTGALFAAAMALGGMAGGGSDPRVAALNEAGRHLGLAFQIRDDLINVGASLAQTGKRPGTDAKRHKATYPRAIGVEAAATRGAEHLELARYILKEYRLLTQPMDRLLGAVEVRER